MKYIIPAMLLLVFLACKKSENTTPPTDPNYVYNVHKDQFLNLINTQRLRGCRCGADSMPPVPALTWNDTLAKAAFQHADDMSKNTYFGYNSPDGSTPGDRIKKLGYDWVRYAENIANAYFKDSAVVEYWFSGTGNCKNLMGAGYKEFGAGMQSAIWTLDLATRK